MFRAVLDTCTLYPDLQRDFMLQLAAEYAYMPLWGTGILFELSYVLERSGLPRERVVRLIDHMYSAFPGSTVEAPKDREYQYDLRDPDDAHVAHAAIIGKADVIITDDTRAGMEACTILREAAIEIINPSEFAANTVSAHPEAGHRALLQIAGRRKAPPTTPVQLLTDLRDRYGMQEVHQILMRHLEE